MDGLALFVGIVGVAGTIAGSVLGARMGGKAVKESVLIAAEKAREAEQTREQQEIVNFRKALLTESVALRDSYLQGVGQYLEATPDGTIFNCIYPVYQRYFIIYEENAHLLGRIDDDRERDLIIRTYTQAKGLLDSYRLNNSMVEKRNYAVGLAPSIIGQGFVPVLAEIEATMRAYTPILKRMHTEALVLFEELRVSLERPVP